MSLFNIASMYIFLGLTTWHWKTNYWAPPWGRIKLPLLGLVNCLLLFF